MFIGCGLRTAVSFSEYSNITYPWPCIVEGFNVDRSNLRYHKCEDAGMKASWVITDNDPKKSGGKNEKSKRNSTGALKRDRKQ